MVTLPPISFRLPDEYCLECGETLRASWPSCSCQWCDDCYEERPCRCDHAREEAEDE